MVALPLHSNEIPGTDSIVSYNKDLEIIQVGKSGHSIRKNDSDTVTLNRTFHSSNGGEAIYPSYQLLISTTDWLSPVANIGVEQKFNDDDENFFDNQTVTNADKTAITQTINFYQTIAAYPDSQLVNDYVYAMTHATDGADAKADGSDDSASAVKESIDENVQAFFKKTKNYQQVTLDLIYVLENYYNLFPFAWAQYKDVVNYYLFSSTFRCVKAIVPRGRSTKQL